VKQIDFKDRYSYFYLFIYLFIYLFYYYKVSSRLQIRKAASSRPRRNGRC